MSSLKDLLREEQAKSQHGAVCTTASASERQDLQRVLNAQSHNELTGTVNSIITDSMIANHAHR